LFLPLMSRLCRLMCGQAMPYRSTVIEVLR
jgi:hypothetical protein